MGWGAIGAAIGGSLVSGLFSAKDASKNRAFQQYNSDTAHQREVKDLKAAGLNPILSAKLGGATTPAGSMPTIPDLGASMNSAMSVQSNISKVDAEIEKISADIGLTEEQTKNIKELTKRVEAEIPNVKADTALKFSQRNSAQATANATNLQNDVNQIISEWKVKNPNITIMQAFGLDGKSLSNLLATLLGGGFVTGAAKSIKKSLQKGGQ